MPRINVDNFMDGVEQTKKFLERYSGKEKADDSILEWLAAAQLLTMQLAYIDTEAHFSKAGVGVERLSVEDWAFYMLQFQTAIAYYTDVLKADEKYTRKRLTKRKAGAQVSPDAEKKEQVVLDIVTRAEIAALIPNLELCCVYIQAKFIVKIPDIV